MPAVMAWRGRTSPVAKPLQIETAKAEIAKPFPDEAILEEKSRRLDELNSELNMDRKENEIVDGAEEITEDGQDKKPTSRDDRDDR